MRSLLNDSSEAHIALKLCCDRLGFCELAHLGTVVSGAGRGSPDNWTDCGILMCSTKKSYSV